MKLYLQCIYKNITDHINAKMVLEHSLEYQLLLPVRLFINMAWSGKE